MTKVMTSILAATIAVALLAVPAYAADLTVIDLQDAAADSVSDSSSSTTTGAKAPSKAKVYVLTKIGDMSCTYNAKGLLTKRANGSTTVTFKYSGTNIKSYVSEFKHGRSQSKTAGKLTYKNGRLAKLVEKGSSSTATDTYTYNKAGHVKKYTHSVTGKQPIKYTCAYDADGRLVKRNASGGDKTKATYGYDDEGNLRSASFSYGSRGYSYDYANKYKSGRLKKKTTTITSRGSYSTTATYAYKKISVPAKYADAVAAQQWSLLNPQVSFSYPLNY